ncbi:uncharacterized protein LOC121654828 [Melanotaenia boesemani]|uniref:uncharacterized protein LOC121654828 n=1 Tax=Melanotaenia boesemani TaxID=1250792 RepID=UPI001C04C538|nr:uncharacterized protein LOC121654828 [Melanotaenia boesemani]
MAANPTDRTSDSRAEIVQSARRLLHLLTERHPGAASDEATSHDMGVQQQGGGSSTAGRSSSLQMEMTRSFPGIFTKGRGKRRFPATTLIPGKKLKPLEVSFYLLPKQFDKSPTEQEKLIHMQAGLGPRTAHIDESTTHEELCDALKILYPKLGTITGGWLLYKSSGGWGSRKLSLVSPDHSGYIGRLLKAASRGGKNLYIAPIQEELNTSPLQLNDETFSSMAKAMCHKCRVDVPLQLLKDHISSCEVIDVNSNNDLPDSDSHPPENSMQSCPVCMEMFSIYSIEEHASTCGESSPIELTSGNTVSEEDQATDPGPSRTCANITEDWSTVSDPAVAASQCADHFLRIHAMESPLTLSMDIRKRPAEQDMALISFYKQTNVEWARPLKCKLEGDAAIGNGVTRFFFSTCMEKLKSGFHINFVLLKLLQVEWETSMHSHFQISPEMFNRIQVWTLAGPLQDIHRVVLKPLL